MKRSRLQLKGDMAVEACRDWNGLYFVVYGNGAAVLRKDPKDVRRFLKLSPGTASRAQLDEWMAELTAAPEPASEPQQSALDASDPNYQTKTVI